MISSNYLTKNAALPSHIRNNAIFARIPSFDKVFGHIGKRANFSINVANIKKPKEFIYTQSTAEIKLWEYSVLNGLFPASNMRQQITGHIKRAICKSVFSCAARGMEFLSYYWTKSHQKQWSKYKITFSSNGEVGAWDIASMSERGIHSCMNWGSPQSKALVGSIIDPFCGVIYLSPTHSDQMGARAVIRYAVSRTIGPCLLIETLYINTAAHPLTNSRQDSIIDLFAQVLFNEYRLPVLYAKTLKEISPEIITRGNLFIPYSKVFDCHPGGGAPPFSYRDSGIQYAVVSSDLLQQFPELNKIKNLL